MFNDSIFRIALGISLSIHIFAISSGGFFHLRPPEEEQKMIEVSYIFPNIEKEKILEKIPEEYDIKEERTKQKTTKSISEQEVFADQKVIQKDEKYLDTKELAELEDYIHYYELIRERIKKNISQSYKDKSHEGKVEVSFVVTKQGALKEVSSKLTEYFHSNYLETLAIESVKKSGPYPIFPDTINKKELSFTIEIIFQKN